jgi:tetratricopeptide (TPR) repeat protein
MFPRRIRDYAVHPSYDDLNPSTARTYRLLSLHTGPDFTIAAAAALLDTGAAAAAEQIASLVEEGLLAGTAPGRWHFPGTTRELAREAALTEDTPSDRAAATARVIQYYLGALAAADLQIEPGPPRIAAAFAISMLNPPAHSSPAAALAWCDAEQANVLHAQQTAAAQGLHPLAWEFADAMRGWCAFRSALTVWESVGRAAIDSARACGDARAEVMATLWLASCQLARADVPAAATLVAQALEIAQASGDRAGEAGAREGAALCALATGNYLEVIDQATRGLAYWQRTSHRYPQAILECLIGRAYAGLGNHEQAITHLNAALATFTALGERHRQGHTLHLIATTYLTGRPAIEDIEEAVTLLDQAAPLLRAEGHLPGLADLLTTLADAHPQLGNTAQARAYLEEAATLHQQLDLPEHHPERIRTSALAAQLPGRGDHTA